MSSSAVSRLSLFTGSEHAPQPSEPSLHWTLTRFYREYVLPQREALGRSPLTIQQDWTQLRTWARVTGDPPILRIDQALCREFVARLRNIPVGSHARSPMTVRKACTHLQGVLNQIGRGRSPESGAAGLLTEVPRLAPPASVETAIKDVWRLEELAAVLAACRMARETSCTCAVPAPLWWDCLVRFLYNTGLRINTALRVTWDMVDRDEPGWITIPRQIYKGGRHGLFLFLNCHAREAIERLRSARQPLLIPWLNWPNSKTWFNRSFGRIVRASGLQPQRQFRCHAIRGCCATELSRISETAADLVLGHRGRSLRLDCYTDPHIMMEALIKLPQPHRPAQRQLF